MEGPTLTWQLRRYGRTLWSSTYARGKNGWLVVRAELRATSAQQARPPNVTADSRAHGPRHWLDALRINAVRYAIDDTTRVHTRITIGAR